MDGSGEALPCAYMPLTFGNIKEKSLKEIWKEMTHIWVVQGEMLLPDEGPEVQRSA